MKFEFDTKNLKRQIEENPLAAATVGAALFTGAGTLLNGVTKVINASTNRKNSKTWAKEVDRRTRTGR